MAGWVLRSNLPLSSDVQRPTLLYVTLIDSGCELSETMMSEAKKGRYQNYGLTLLKGAGIALVLIVLANLGMVYVYRNRALPNSYVGRFNAGGRSFTSLQSIRSSDILPAKITLVGNVVSVEEALGSLGISVDSSASVKALKKTHQWFPILAFVFPRHSPLPLAVDKAQFNKTELALAQTFRSPAEGRHVVLSGTTFSTMSGHSGHQLDSTDFLPAVLSAVQKGKATLNVPTRAVPIPHDDPHLQSDIQGLQKQLNDNIGFVYQGHTITPTKTTVGTWFKPDGVSMAVSETAVEAYLNSEVARQFSITIANSSDLATAATFALSNTDAVNFNVTPATGSTIVRTYCTGVDDESSAVLTELIGKLAETYNDARGWNNGGKIAFRHVTSDCQYTVWMAAPSQMTTFGAICDNYYNCQVGTNVILNYDRWTTSTPPWQRTGGSLNDYHTLMIDHETGHRLGFPDNPTCPGADQPAPVMMQQSIDLKGCVFNIWPRPAEFTQLDQMLNLPVTAQPSQPE